jgi:hypothetical protein
MISAKPCRARLGAKLVGGLLAAASGFLLRGCAPPPNAAIAQVSPATQRNQPSATIVSRDIPDRFPGAALLGEAEFASGVVGRLFRYRELDSNIVVERPKEVFAAGGQYRIHWLRTISYGTYSIERGIVSIDCADCPYSFLNLGRERILFRHEGRLLTARANGEGSVVELIPEP